MVKRSRARRMGESAYGLLLLVKMLVAGVVVLVVLAAGAWASWTHGRDAMVTGLEQGTMTVQACGDHTCTGPFAPADGAGTARPSVTVDKSATKATGEKIPVAVVPGTDDVVRTGPDGILHAWVPFAGALLLASLVIAFGLRMRRTAVGAGLVGAALLAAAFALT
ncbi:hypothetical protein NGB36_07920 [Streptomyces sp. RB6PN25]|uniref:Integral membrane protein n=1 Tax=Streptomyces humicola TaxID=2953240 RepID=A0ABT1PU81_9ACTN|nr:hypothetical protein [Streptomyces humicola]MCQ4080530.1 hypothetical protein [Streptomyces humicola]